MNKYIKLSVFTAMISLGITNVPLVFAEGTPKTIEVTGNGAESQNNVSSNTANSTTAQQQNDASATNKLENTATTGSNSIDTSTAGGQEIKTGDAQSIAGVSNDLNQSTVAVGCCDQGTTSVSVSNNGEGSENTINSSQNTQTSVTAVNGAKIANNFKITTNTGNNKANFNTGGETKIITGDVTVHAQVANGPINVNRITLVKGSNALKSTLAIAGNGAFSDNIVTEVIEHSTVYQQDNFVSIFNNVEALMSTGGNEANYNSEGNVLIMTGDIIADLLTSNLANFNIIETIKKDILKVDETPTANEETTTHTSNQPESTTSVVSVAGASGSSTSNDNAAQNLPITGTNLLFFLLLANIMMFFLGAYLRLRSGRSPGYSFSL